jgi:dTDP-4-dehydrorhamnose 3,5-epimerase
MKIEETSLPGVLLVRAMVHRDDRGYFLETFRGSAYEEHGIPARFAQDSLSWSREGVLRGLHLQWPRAQGKLVYVIEGEVFDVAVDLRRSSPAYGRWVGHTLSAENAHQVWIPEGFAHGFVVTRGPALFAYKCTRDYDPGSELSVRWDDPDLGIDWTIARPTLSRKDAAAPLLGKIPEDRLPD